MRPFPAIAVRLLGLAFACAELPAAWAEPVDMELVLAVDVSRSGVVT